MATLGDKPLVQRGNWDTTALLSVMIGDWQGVFRRNLGATERSIVAGLFIAAIDPESRVTIIALALLQFLMLCIAIVAFVRQARRKEIARLSAMPVAEPASATTTYTHSS